MTDEPIVDGAPGGGSVELGLKYRVTDLAAAERLIEADGVGPFVAGTRARTCSRSCATGS